MGTMYVSGKTLCLTYEVANMEDLFFDKKRLEPKGLLILFLL